jgi:outer membrane protein
MRTFPLTCALLAALLAPSAHAQFANRSIGLSTGYMWLADVDESELDWGIPVGLYGTSYIDSGWDITYHALQLMILTERTSGRKILGIAPSFGVRYLFSEEFFRPYAGADVSYLHIFSDLRGSTNFVGIGPNVGFDYFVADQWSLGLRGQWNFYLWLNHPVQQSLSITAEIATYY